MTNSNKLRNNGWFHVVCMFVWAIMSAALIVDVGMKFYYSALLIAFLKPSIPFEACYIIFYSLYIIVWLILSFTLFLGCGHHSDRDEPYLYALEAMPLDLCLPFLAAASFIWLENIFSSPFFLNYTVDWNNPDPYLATYGWDYSLFYGHSLVIFLISAVYFFAAEIFMHLFIAQIRCRAFLKSTLTGRLIHFLGIVLQALPSIWRGLLGYSLFFGILMFLSALLTIADDGFSFLTILGLIFVLWLIGILVLLQIQEIRKKIERLSDGNLEETPHDYISRKKMLFAFRDSFNRLCRVGEIMDEVVAEKVKHETFQTELITNVSHDIKTPLTSIINYVDLLSKEEKKEDADPAKKLEYMEVLTRQSVRLKKLIEDLIEASKASSGQLSCEFYDFDLGIFLSQISGEYEERMESSNLKLNLVLPEQPIHILADARHLSRVLDNLLNNARKYSMPNTRVYLELYEDKATKDAVISMKNISAAELNITAEELMQRFIRGDKSRHQEGNGLGLSIVRSLTELQNGRFDIEIDGDLYKAILRFPIIDA